MRSLHLVVSIVTALDLFACGGASAPPGPRGCDHGGDTYPDGASFASTDGCNQCSCQDGSVLCTTRACVRSCEDIITEYGNVVEAAKACDPATANTCTESFVEGLACGCSTFGSSAHAPELAQAMALQAEYATNSCQQGVVCGPCQAPMSAHCSSKGRCEDD